MEKTPETDKIINNVRRLSNFIDTAYLKDEDEKFFFMKSDYHLLIKQIEVLYEKWFPKSKKMSDIDIINHLFRDIFKKDAKHYVKYGTQCLLKSTKRVFEVMENNREQGNGDQFMANIRLLREIAFEAPIFLETAFQIMEDSIVDFGHGKRFKLEPRETLNASVFVLKQLFPKNLVGNTAISPTSTFLIRQAIELWLQDIFGIHSVWDEKEERFIKIQPERLFTLLDSKGLIVQIPVPKASIEKIHAWTQRYIHTGLMNSVWEIEHAQHVLRPLFYPENVIISEKFYNSIEKRIQEMFENPNLKLNQQKKHSSTIVK